MGIRTILSDFQKTTLSLFKKTPLAKTFYLAGGTALSEFYLQHRKSEDLDFFTQEELLGENLMQVSNLQDMPIMIKEVDMKKVLRFFLIEAKKLQKEIFK